MPPIDPSRLPQQAQGPQPSAWPGVPMGGNPAKQVDDANARQRLDIERHNSGRQDQVTDNTISNTKFDNEARLRTEYQNLPEVRSYKAVLPQLLHGLNTAPTPAGDNALIYNYAKIMDTLTGVREGEQRSAEQSAAYVDQLVATLKKNLDSGGSLPDSLREGYRREMDKKVHELAEQYKFTRSQYAAHAKDYGIEDRRIIGSDDDFAPFRQQYTDAKKRLGWDQAPTSPELAPPDQHLSTENKTVEVPKEMQQEYANFLGGVDWNKITPAELRAKQTELYGKYNFGVSPKSDEELQNFINFYRENPDAPKAAIPGSIEPLTGLGKLAAEVSESAPGTALMTAANAGGFGVPALLTGQGGRNAMRLAEEENPKSALLGEVLGSVAPVSGLEKIVVGGMRHAAGHEVEKETLKASLLANGAYGGISGFNNSDDGHGLSGALGGTASGLAGAALGHVITGGAKPFQTKATQEALDQLDGVDLSNLQRMGLGHVEEALNAVPGFRGGAEAGIESFNRDNANRALSNLDGVGNRLGINLPTTLSHEADTAVKGNKQLADTFNAAYNALWPKIQGNVDPTFVQKVAAAKMAVANNPTQRTLFRNELAPLEQRLFGPNGQFDGAAVKDVRSRLDTLAEDWAAHAESGQTANGSDYKAMAKMAREMKDEITGLVERTNPEMGATLKQIDTGYRHMKTIFDASNRGLSTAEGAYGPGQLLTSIKKLDTSVDNGASATGQAFDEPYALAAQKILGSSNAPEKINPGRSALVLATLAGTGAASHVAGSDILPLLMGAGGTALYAPIIKELTKKVVSGARPAVIDNDLTRQLITQVLSNPKKLRAAIGYEEGMK